MSASEDEQAERLHEKLFGDKLRALIPSADHGISPAQLREKVEALEKRSESLASQDVLNFGHLTERLDAALKRIEELEKWSHSHTTIGHVDLTVHKTLKAKP